MVVVVAQMIDFLCKGYVSIRPKSSFYSTRATPQVMLFNIFYIVAAQSSSRTRHK